MEHLKLKRFLSTSHMVDECNCQLSCLLKCQLVKAHNALAFTSPSICFSADRDGAQRQKFCFKWRNNGNIVESVQVYRMETKNASLLMHSLEYICSVSGKIRSYRKLVLLLLSEDTNRLSSEMQGLFFYDKSIKKSDFILMKPQTAGTYGTVHSACTTYKARQNK